MLTYSIELATRSTVRLIKNTNPKAAKPFDGGSVFSAPEAYPAMIVDTWANTQEQVSDVREWQALALKVAAHGSLAA